jgi:hypothetical protein
MYINMIYLGQDQGTSNRQERKTMETKTLENGRVEVKMTWERLAAMVDNGQELYQTPGRDEPYWNSNPSFVNDVQVGTAWDFESVDTGCEFSREDDDPDTQEEEYVLVYDPEAWH